MDGPTCTVDASAKDLPLLEPAAAAAADLPAARPLVATADDADDASSAPSSPSAAEDDDVDGEGELVICTDDRDGRKDEEKTEQVDYTSPSTPPPTAAAARSRQPHHHSTITASRSETEDIEEEEEESGKVDLRASDPLPVTHHRQTAPPPAHNLRQSLSSAFATYQGKQETKRGAVLIRVKDDAELEAAESLSGVAAVAAAAESAAAASAAAKGSDAASAEAAPASPGSGSPSSSSGSPKVTSLIHNKELWIEISMHAQIVANLATMAQGQKLSAPPIEMVRNHLAHILTKLKELVLLNPQLAVASTYDSVCKPVEDVPDCPINSFPGKGSAEFKFAASNGTTVAPATTPPPDHSNHNTAALSRQQHSALLGYGSPGSPASLAYPFDCSSREEYEASRILAKSRAMMELAATATRNNNPPPRHQFHHYVGQVNNSSNSNNSNGSTNIRTHPHNGYHRPIVSQAAAPPAPLPQRPLKFTSHMGPKGVNVPADPPRAAAVAAAAAANGADVSKNGKKRKRPPPSCDQCHTMYTPEWRRGPRGAGTLCNACGLRYSRQEKRLKKREEQLQIKRRGSIDAILNP